jgi:hypothetical protein
VYKLVDPDAEDGILVYIKTSITGDESPDVINYQREHPDFPHQTTADQWFTESQFESYRRLGQHVVEQLCKPIERIARPASGAATHAIRAYTKEVFQHLRDHWPVAGGVDKDASSTTSEKISQDSPATKDS